MIPESFFGNESKMALIFELSGFFYCGVHLCSSPFLNVYLTLKISKNVIGNSLFLVCSFLENSKLSKTEF